MDQLNISRISGRAIWYPAGYRISKKAGLSGRISGTSLVKIRWNLQIQKREKRQKIYEKNRETECANLRDRYPIR
jgi:hypothetical protein